MKRLGWIGILVLLALAACDTTTREARRMVKRAEQLVDTLPDSTVHLIDSVLRMPANLSERQRMDMALLQAEALFADRGNEISPVLDERRQPYGGTGRVLDNQLVFSLKSVTK